MKILFVLENYYPNIGGVETLFKSLVEELSRNGHPCTIVTSLLAKEESRIENQGNITIIRVPVANRYLFTLKALGAVLRHIRSCDLVQTTSYNAALPAFIGALLFRKKILVTFHEAWGKLWFQLPYLGRLSKVAHYCFEQFLLRLPFDRFIAVSRNTARRLAEEGVATHRIKTIYNGIDYGEFISEQARNEEPKTPFTFTYFGRLGISKGLDLLLEAATVTKTSLPASRLQLIVPRVPGNFLEVIRQKIRQEGLEAYISFRHHLPFPVLKQAIVDSDCVVIPSYSEGFCFAAVETTALGTPIISSGQAALAEVVGGRFITMDSLSAEGLVRAMEKAYRQQWEEGPVRRFELSETVNAYIGSYEELLANGHSGNADNA